MNSPEPDKLAAVFGIEQIATWREQPASAAPPEARAWDRRPITKTVKGVKREFFLVGALAAALGRSTVTIRAWEAEGIIPKVRWRTKAPVLKRSDRPPLPGKAVTGKRLYSREQIEATVAAARATRVYDLRDVASADWHEFARLVHAAW
jgi:hypothetical protein